MRDRLFIVAFPGAATADTYSDRLQERELSRIGEPEVTGDYGDGGTLSDFDSFGEALAHWSRLIGRPIPNPVEPRPNGTDVRLSPEFGEWLMGIPDNRISSAPIPYSAKIKAIGNGVCPPQAEYALRHLLTQK